MENWYDANTDYFGLSKFLQAGHSLSYDGQENPSMQQKVASKCSETQIRDCPESDNHADVLYPMPASYVNALNREGVKTTAIDLEWPPNKTIGENNGNVWSTTSQSSAAQFAGRGEQIKWTSAPRKYLEKIQTAQDAVNADSSWSSAYDHFHDSEDDVFHPDHRFQPQPPPLFRSIRGSSVVHDAGIVDSALKGDILRNSLTSSSCRSLQSNESVSEFSPIGHMNGSYYNEWSPSSPEPKKKDDRNDSCDKDDEWENDSLPKVYSPPPTDLPASRRSMYMSATGELSCVLCKRNGETREFYTTHVLKDNRGKVICPILRKYTCPICGATGNNAHTQSHCPVFVQHLACNEESPQSLHSRRYSSGKLRLVSGRSGV